MDKERLFSIGTTAKMFHLSVSSLRHYEAIGLIKPEYTDPDSGYRYYGARQFEVLNTIRYLRALDMPLTEISDFLRNRDVENIEEKLIKQKQAVIERQKELKIIERKIDNRLKMLKDVENSVFDTVYLAKKESCNMVWLDNSLVISSFLDMEVPMRAFEYGQDEAVLYLGKVGIGISEENLRKGSFEIYDGMFLILDEEDCFNGTVWKHPEEMSAVIRFHGSHNEAGEQYKKLMSYINEHRLEISGFSREITMIDQGFTNDVSKFVTEISIPIK